MPTAICLMLAQLVAVALVARRADAPLPHRWGDAELVRRSVAYEGMLQ